MLVFNNTKVIPAADRGSLWGAATLLNRCCICGLMLTLEGFAKPGRMQVRPARLGRGQGVPVSTDATVEAKGEAGNYLAFDFSGRFWTRPSTRWARCRCRLTLRQAGHGCAGRQDYQTMFAKSWAVAAPTPGCTSPAHEEVEPWNTSGICHFARGGTFAGEGRIRATTRCMASGARFRLKRWPG
jgi:hypothetical protein